MPVNSVSDGELLSALRRHEESALRGIYDRYYRSMLGEAYRLVQDADACKDMAQEVLIELWRRRENLEIRTSLPAYLRRAVVNKAINYINARKLVVDDVDERDYKTADTSEADIDRKEKEAGLEEALHRAIAGLPEKCRIVFTLSRFEGMSHKEIAEKLNISVKTIENQITKAMKTLKEALGPLSEMSSIVILALKTWWQA